MIEASEFFFLLFLRRIFFWSGVTLDKLSPCTEKTETLKLSLKISISEGFYILVILLDKIVLEIDLDLFNVFSVSVLWVELYLSIDLTLSVLLLLGVSTVLLDACDFSFFYCVNLLFFWNRRSDVFPYNIIFCLPFFFYHVSISYFYNRVISIDQCLFGFIQIPTCFLTFSRGLSDLFGNGSLILEDIISVLDFLQQVNYRISSIF